MKRIILICASVFFTLSLVAQERVSTKSINDDVLFSPQFHAFKRGRVIDERGVGKSWYNRFTLLHVSDIHYKYSQLSEALQVANGKVSLVVNTGDVASGCTAEDKQNVNSTHESVGKTVQENNALPYMQVPGNHDVTGLTKKDYFDRVCSIVERYNPEVVWGDAENYRAYGYVDFVDDSYKGNFRIIMLDPFDYNDGQFENPYGFMSAVFSQKQVDWLVSALKDAAKNGHHVLTIMHYSFGDDPVFNEERANPDATFFQDPFMIPDIIDAAQHQKRLSKRYADKSGLNDVKVDVDFSNLPKLEFVAHLFGHIHSRNDYQCQKLDGTKYDILMLGETAIGVPGTALNKIDIMPGTLNDISFSALEIDVLEKVIYRVSYGAYLHHDGSNRDRMVRIPYRFDN